MPERSPDGRRGNLQNQQTRPVLHEVLTDVREPARVAHPYHGQHAVPIDRHRHPTNNTSMGRTEGAAHAACNRGLTKDVANLGSPHDLCVRHETSSRDAPRSRVPSLRANLVNQATQLTYATFERRRRMVSGSRSIARSSARAGASGVERRCSQSRRVPMGTP